MSSTKVPRPRTNRASSLRGTGPYAPFCPAALISLPPSRALRLVVPEARHVAQWGGVSSAPGHRNDVAAFDPAPAAFVVGVGPTADTSSGSVASLVLGGPADRPHDVLVARAPADLAGQGLADLLR